MNKIKNIITTVLFAVLIFSVSAVCILKPQGEYSEGERRALAKMPEFSGETLFSGEFTEGFENYSTDQFPMREDLRTVKAVFSKNILGKLDNNGLFVHQGHISTLDSPQNEDMMDYAANKFLAIKNKFLKNDNIYFAIVPDKNFILAKDGGYPVLDYDAFIEGMKSRTEYMKYIDITPMLSLDDYYKTDSHWRQENITDIAKHIATEMGSNIPSEYTENTLENPFYGVYAGQSALPAKPDEIKYLTNSVMSDFKVTYYGNGNPEPGEMYDMKKAFGRDPYEMFLSGSMPLVTIENPNSKSEKELIIFRDSFGSSIAPLLAQGYSKTTVIDIRYMRSDFIGNFAKFENADTLFIYSTSLLNNSTALQ
ncbi:MAG: hypothetical protein IKB55_05015 [Clostridia bacterium]|nr:hypothetical protein [Clostridia bacterium]